MHSLVLGNHILYVLWNTWGILFYFFVVLWNNGMLKKIYWNWKKRYIFIMNYKHPIYIEVNYVILFINQLIAPYFFAYYLGKNGSDFPRDLVQY